LRSLVNVFHEGNYSWHYLLLVIKKAVEDVPML
jgi:hypothetical protein